MSVWLRGTGPRVGGTREAASAAGERVEQQAPGSRGTGVGIALGPPASVRRRGTGLGAVAGVVAAGAGLAAAEIVAAVTGTPQTPVVAVGSAFVDVVPPWLKEFAVQSFGAHDKQVLVVGVLVVLAGLAALAGAWARRWRPAAVVAAGLLGGVGCAAAVTRPHAGAGALAPSVAAAVAAFGVLWLLVGRLGSAAEPVHAAEGPSATSRPAVAGGVGVGGTAPLMRAVAGDVGGAARAGSARSPGAAPGRPGAGRPGAAGRDGPAVPLGWAVPDVGVDRRGFLVAAGVVSGIAALSGGLAHTLGAKRITVEQARADLRLPAPGVRLPAGIDPPVRGLTPWLTPPGDFYRVDTAISVPLVDPATWRLRVHGMVDRELAISFSDLLRRPRTDAWVTLTCVSNIVGGGLTGNGLWSGVRIADVLREAGVRPGADAVRSTSADGWTAGTPLTALTDDRPALLAYELDGKPLPLAHGFPVRMVVPGLYGYVSATKWVTDLEVTRFDRFTAYWTDRGWSARGPIKTSSRIDVPYVGSTVRAGPITVAGVAWAQTRGIRQVQVRVDQGPWTPATLDAEPSVDTWRQWTWAWHPVPGTYVLSCRAIDGTGAIQSGRDSSPLPNGATGWQRVLVKVV